ncbi:competence protein CoiA family protein [Rhodococcus ruber]|uniref:Competence protein CoiA-like N-terminal domain-containing protein n=1 Tax=Rhodococcus ruber TaxID=1830 RepID=A0A098BIX6_9NOCA|nr:competence protein CoiA family protein [Rhodococcus ruber]MCD2129635.1 hypothetical protein [Rhodococcus ruber]MCZ4506143.1 competence protein CoiA family protein [Rhodococcus ruber]MCZ4533244.1 competence protein CoiA family protein [Rhodococcus ruber]MCZ4623681.1 competence protein CoiA family protein [Rhodococcus ruber]MDI9970776.1 competence protein CoiA family protein [Rhodococcus ruber]
MKHAFDLALERLVSAADAGRRRAYVCPCCCGQVHLRSGTTKIAHFAHNPGEGTPLCEQYHPGSGNYGSPGGFYGEAGTPLFLHLHEDGTGWTLFFDLEPLSLAESRRSLPSVLAFEGLELHRPGSRPRKLRAESLWPGAGRTTVKVEPSRQHTTVNTVGQWPSGIRPNRWRSTLTGLSPNGVLFVPYRGGTFRRYDWATPVHWGDRVVLVGPAHCAPPGALDVVSLSTTSTAEGTWHAWLVRLPRSFDLTAYRWLSKFGITIGQRREKTRIVSPPIEYGAGGVPRFLLGDPIVVAPSPPAGVLAAESYATMNAKSLGRRRVAGSAPAYAVTAVESGALRIRTDAERDVARVDIVTEGDIELDISAAVWCVRHADGVLLPYTSHRFATRDVAPVLHSDIPALRYTVTAKLPDDRTESVRSVGSSAATDWIRQRVATATGIEIEAGNLGFLRLELPRSGRSRPAEPPPVHARRSNWPAAYALSLDTESNPVVPHWQIGTGRAAATRIRRLPNVGPWQ